jgi:preprotein translocase SecE subunit
MNIKRFFDETIIEFRHINWPKRNEAIKLTLWVILFSLVLAGFLGIFDNLFLFLLKKFVLG